MTSALLLENFEKLAGAPNGIPKLRELILALAVSGRLEPPEADTTAGKRTLAALAGLSQETNSGARHGRTELLKLDSSNLPLSWACTSLLDVTRGDGFFRDGDWIETKDQDPEGGVRLVQLADVGDGTYKDQSSRFLTEERAAELNCAFLLVGDILVARLPNPLGRACRFPGDPKPAVTAVDVCIVRPNEEFLDPDFGVLAINAPSSRSWIADRATGTTRRRISRGNLADLPIPVPLLAEQKRIVAKVDKLMALCDDLEAKQQAKRAKQIALNRASLHALTEPEGTSLTAAWHRVRDHFDGLCTISETVAELRQTILQLAVMGRLVPQDPSDEPASELLKKIQAEKQRLIAEGTIRKTKLLPIEPGEIPFDVPGSWEWVKTGEFLLSVSDGDHQPPPKSETGVPFLVIGNVSSGQLDFSETRFVPKEYYDQLDPIRVPRQGDVLYTVTGSYGLPLVVDTDREFCVQRHIAVLKVPRDVSSGFVALWLGSPLAYDQATAGATGTAQKTVSLGVLRSIVLPTPPLAEQKRIVGKVNQLMALCDDLEAKLQQAQTDADNLLAAIVHELSAA